MAELCDILSMNKDELEAFLQQNDEKRFRAAQILEWIYRKRVTSFDRMTTLSKELQTFLSARCPFPVLKQTRHQVSTDGTQKFLFTLADANSIETVFIPMEGHGTLCISSQVGCKFGCAFCASGLKGFGRNLTAGEILGQILFAQNAVKVQITHIVFMGVGEPFDNYDNVQKAVRAINAPWGCNIGARRITISTSGVVPGIEKLAQEGLQIELSVSLHSPDNEIRSRIMPVNRKYPLPVLIKACRAYARLTNRQVTFEYILIRGLTCTRQAALELSQLMKGWLAKVNLIAYNPVQEFDFEAPSREEVREFKKILDENDVIYTVRKPRGPDIAAACGQLRLRQ